MSHRIPTVPMRGRPPKLTAEQQARLMEWHENRRTMGDWAKEFGVAKETLRAYIRGDHKFPVRQC
jgi:transposase